MTLMTYRDAGSVGGKNAVRLKGSSAATEAQIACSAPVEMTLVALIPSRPVGFVMSPKADPSFVSDE